MANVISWRTLYWLLAGALAGCGVIALLSIGLPFIVVALVMVIVGAARVGGRGLWALLVGFGAAPALLLLRDVTAAPWGCDTGGQTTTQAPGVSYYSCVQTPLGVLTTYHVLAAGFGAMALVGLLLGAIALVRGAAHNPHGRHAPT